MALSHLGRFHRKDMLFQIFSDLLRHNSNNNNSNVRQQNFRHYYGDINVHKIPLRLQTDMFKFICDRRAVHSIPSTILIPNRLLSSDNVGSVNNYQLVEFKNLSLSNKKIVSNITSLKIAFLQDLNILISNDCNHIMFNYYQFDETGTIFTKQVRYILNYQSKLSSTRDSFKQLFHKNDTLKTSEFMFLTFDNLLHDKLISHPGENCDDFENITIFDDPFNGLAFYQQTKLPTIVLNFNKNFKNFDNENLRLLCKAINQKFKTIYYWSNNVEFCRILRKACFQYFNPSLTYVISTNESALKMLRKNQREKFATVFETATRADRPNITPVAFTGDDLFNRLNDSSIRGIPWLRFPKLTEHLKGHRPGELTIITGPTGCGKTTFASEYSLDLCQQGVPTLWGSFEIKYLDLEMKMMSQFVGKNFDQCNRYEFDKGFEQFSQLPLYFMNFHGQTDINEVLEEARLTVLINGIEHIIIDNLQFMLGLSTDATTDRFHKQDIVLGAIRDFATKFNCHITLVAHPRKEKEEMCLNNNSLYGGIKASQEADNIMILMNKYNHTYKCSKYIQITKNRAHGNLGVVPLYFEKSTQCFSLFHKKNKELAVETDNPKSNVCMDEVQYEF